MAVKTAVKTYTPSPSVAPTAGSLSREFSAVKAAVDGLVQMTPQAATRAPQTLQDGMIRLARSPWYPAAGQVADGWVYYDLPTDTWLFL